MSVRKGYGLAKTDEVVRIVNGVQFRGHRSESSFVGSTVICASQTWESSLIRGYAIAERIASGIDRRAAVWKWVKGTRLKNDSQRRKH